MEKAVKKQKLDMLNGSIWNKIPQFALPVAAVGANSPLISFIVNLFIGVALGTNVVIARAVGQGDQGAIHKAVHTSILVALTGGVAVGVFGEAVAVPLLSLLHVPQDVFPLALLYLRIYLIGLPVILLYNFEAAIFRSVGETKIPLLALAFSGMLNVVLNIFFVVVLHMTVNGVAVATVISNGVSSILLYRRLRHTDQEIHFDPKALRMDPKILKQILQIGLPAGIQGAVFAVSNIVIQSAINSLGTIVMAASSAAYNIEIITYDILNSFSQACTTFVGQNFGAGKRERCKKTLVLCLMEGMLTLSAAILFILFFGKTLLAVFNSNPEVVSTGYIRLMLIMLSHPFSLLYEVMAGYLRGFGISLAPAVLTTAGVCGVRILWINTVFPQAHTFQSVIMAYPVSLSITALFLFITLLYYRPTYKFSKTQTRRN